MIPVDASQEDPRNDEEEWGVSVVSERAEEQQSLFLGSFLTRRTQRVPRSLCIVLLVVSLLLSSLFFFWDDVRHRDTTGMKCYEVVLDILHGTSPSSLPSNFSYIPPEEFGGLQGLAWLPSEKAGGTNILFVGYTHGVRKLQVDQHMNVVQMLGDRLYNQTSEFPSIRTSTSDGEQVLPIVHFGGISVIHTNGRGSEILFAAHTDLDDDKRGGGMVVGVNVETMEPNNNTTAAYNPNAANDWVAVDYKAGIGYAGAFFNVSMALRFRIDTLEDLDPLTFTGTAFPEHGINYVQSATVQGSTLLLGTNDFQGSLYHVEIGSGIVLGRQSLLLGNEMDGLTAIGSDHLLIGFNRRHSHEKIPLQSVILLEARRHRIGGTLTNAFCEGSISV